MDIRDLDGRAAEGGPAGGMERRDGFLFYRSYFEAISQLSPEDQVTAYQAVCDYGLNSGERELSGPAAAVFILTKPNLDASRKKAAAGSAGGRARADGKQGGSRPQAIKDKGQGMKDKGRETGDGVGKGADMPRFTPPTPEEVAAYVKERGSGVIPREFIDFYASKGWMVGKTPMKDWKAACRNAEQWERFRRPTASERPCAQRESFAEIAARLEREGGE